MRTPQWLIKVSLALLHTFVSCDSVIQLGPDNDEAFIKFYGGAFDQNAKKVIPAIDEGYLIIGSTTSHTQGEDSNIYVIKTDPSGNEEWSKSYGINTRNEIAYDASISPSGNNYLIIGTSWDANGKPDALLLLIDPFGDPLGPVNPFILDNPTHNQLLLPNSRETARSFVMDDFGQIILGGEILRDNGEWDAFLWKFLLNENQSSSTGLSIQKPPDWLKFRILGFPENELLTQVIKLPFEEIGVLMETHYSPKPLKERNLLFFRTNSKGVPIYSQVFGSQEDDMGAHVFPHAGGYTLTGTSDDKKNPILIELDKNFNFLSQSELSSDQEPLKQRMAQSLIRRNNNYFILGENIITGDSTSFFLLETNLSGEVIQEETFGNFTGAQAGSFFVEGDKFVACATISFGSNKMACLIKVNSQNLTPYPLN